MTNPNNLASTSSKVEPSVIFTENELRTIYFILSYIGGSPETTPRKYVDSVLKKLSNYDYSQRSWDEIENIDLRSTRGCRALYFEKV